MREKIESARFFRSQQDWRAWLAKNHDKSGGVLIGLHKTGAGKPTVTYKHALDEALCFGWIDGVRKRIDDDSYSVRFSPRTKKSIWSAVNLKRAAELEKAGVMHASGLAVYRARDPRRARLYSFENRPKELAPPLEKKFKADKKAWAFFKTQPPGYRRLAVWYVMSAKKDETREKRLAELIQVSAKGARLGLGKK